MIAAWAMLLGLALCQAADNKQQFFADDPKLDKIREDCKKQTKVEDDIAAKIDVGDIDNDSVDRDHNAKCYVSCVLEKSEFAKSGPPSLENIKKLLSLSDPGGIAEIVKMCWSEGRNAGSNSCEGRFVIFKCIIKNGQKTLSGSKDKNADDGKNKGDGGDGKDSKAGIEDKTVGDNSKENDKNVNNENSGNSDKNEDYLNSGKDVTAEKSDESDESAKSDNSGKGAAGSNDNNDGVNKTATS